MDGMISRITAVAERVTEWKRDFWLPYFMPCVWRGIIALAFAAGVGVGAAIALWTIATLGIRSWL